jgi:RHS repeat-associated protein
MFTGRPWLADVGLYDFRLRLYDPRAGRFTTRDVLGPWGDKVNLGNAYAFGGNNPLGMVDPSGAMAVPGISTHDGSVIDPLTGWRGYLPGWGEAEASERPEEEDAPEADRSIPRWIAETVVAALKWAGLGPTLQQADRAGLGVNRELDLAIGKGETETIREHPELRDLAKAAAWQHNYAAQVPHDAQYGAELLAQQAVLGVAGKAGQKAAEAVVADLVAAVRAERAVKVGEAVGDGARAVGKEPNRIYSARELVRRSEAADSFHNFPESFNKSILSGNRQVIGDDYMLYTQRGTINGVEGTFEIGVRPSASGRTEIITHRFFKPDE